MLRIPVPTAARATTPSSPTAATPARPAPGARRSADLERLERLRLPARQPQGPHSEYWQHVQRLPAWLVVERDTLTHEIADGQARARRRAKRSGGDEPAQPYRLPRRPHRPRAARSPSPSTAGATAAIAGDTLASALLANGVALVGRSFKYHRPRGLLAAGAEEPNALVDAAAAARRREPNIAGHHGRAVSTASSPTARTAGRRVGFDLDGDQRAGSRRFLRPASTTRPSWAARAAPGCVYEPFIRRAAGLGRAHRGRPIPTRYETRQRVLRRAGRRRRPGRARRGAGRRPHGRARRRWPSRSRRSAAALLAEPIDGAADRWLPGDRRRARSAAAMSGC